MSAARVLVKLRAKHGRKIINNPDDGSCNCLELQDGQWVPVLIGVSRDVAQEFFRGTLGTVLEQRP